MISETWICNQLPKFLRVFLIYKYIFLMKSIYLSFNKLIKVFVILETEDAMIELFNGHPCLKSCISSNTFNFFLYHLPNDLAYMYIVILCLLFNIHFFYNKKVHCVWFYRYPRRRQESTGRATVVVDLTESDDGRSKVKGSHFLPLFRKCPKLVHMWFSNGSFMGTNFMYKISPEM